MIERECFGGLVVDMGRRIRKKKKKDTKKSCYNLRGKIKIE